MSVRRACVSTASIRWLSAAYSALSLPTCMVATRWNFNHRTSHAKPQLRLTSSLRVPSEIRAFPDLVLRCWPCGFLRYPMPNHLPIDFPLGLRTQKSQFLLRSSGAPLVTFRLTHEKLASCCLAVPYSTSPIVHIHRRLSTPPRVSEGAHVCTLSMRFFAASSNHFSNISKNRTAFGNSESIIGCIAFHLAPTLTRYSKSLSR